RSLRALRAGGGVPGARGAGRREAALRVRGARSARHGEEPRAHHGRLSRLPAASPAGRARGRGAGASRHLVLLLSYEPRTVLRGRGGRALALGTERARDPRRRAGRRPPRASRGAGIELPEVHAAGTRLTRTTNT